jgi:hypothetical protein
VFTFKLLITPILIAAATMAHRRWGPTVGGWFVGLPLTSGPVSIFLALEQGRPFAATAARSSILGLLGVGAFCVGYARASQRFGPAVCLTTGFLAYAAATLVAQEIEGGPWLAFALVCAVLAAALSLMPRVPRAAAQDAAPWWDLPLRIVAATSMVLAITTAASMLGPTWSGLLSPFPVFSSVLAAFAHHMSGASAAARLQRGVVVGIYSFAAFFLVVALLVQSRSLVATYAWATAAAVGVNGLTLLGLWRARR